MSIEFPSKDTRNGLLLPSLGHLLDPGIEPKSPESPSIGRPVLSNLSLRDAYVLT